MYFPKTCFCSVTRGSAPCLSWLTSERVRWQPPSRRLVSPRLYISLLYPSSPLTSQPLLLYTLRDLKSMPSRPRRERTWPRLGARRPQPRRGGKACRVHQQRECACGTNYYQVASGLRNDSNIGKDGRGGPSSVLESTVPWQPLLASVSPGSQGKSNRILRPGAFFCRGLNARDLL
jgi:hypothetical protein